MGKLAQRHVMEAMAGEYFSNGPIATRFENRFSNLLNVPHAKSTTSGSVALLLAMMASNVRRGDEIILPNRGWIAAAHAAHLLGARIVVVDVLPDRPVMDVSLVEEKLTKRTKAVVPIHLNGRAVDMFSLNELAKQYKVSIIEDAAQALCSGNHSGFLGTQSRFGCFSFSMPKLLQSGQGGIVVSHNKADHQKLDLLSNHGVKDTFTDQWKQPGFNFKYPDLLAALALSQLRRLPGRLARMRKIYDRYLNGIVNQELDFLELIPVNTDSGEIPLYVECLTQHRSKLTLFLANKGIQIRPSYPNVSGTPYLDATGDYPNSLVFEEQGITLPCGPDQSLRNVDTVLTALTDFGKTL